MWSYEAGAKLALLENQLSLDAAVYYEDWSNVHQKLQFNGLYMDYQVGDAEIYGLDLSLCPGASQCKALTVQATANVKQRRV
ncbi:MAG: hypothetical protein R3E64_12250 [Halioglobus sp.]